MTDVTMNAEDGCSLDKTSAPFLHNRENSQETKREMNDDNICIRMSDDNSSLELCKIPSYQINCALHRYHLKNVPTMKEKRVFRTVK